MDTSRFDDLTRQFGAARSRRSLLGAALGAAAAALGLNGASAAARCRNDGLVCSKNGDCCSAICLPKNRQGRRLCGQIVAPCQRPQDCPPGPTPCQPATCDSGTCGIASPPDFQSDRENCGSCGNFCPSRDSAATSCIQGGCSSICFEGLSDCLAGGCVELQTNFANCGSCGFSCAEGETCCAGTCAATNSNDANCGACGNACPSGQSCCGSVCQDSSSDVDNCGACDNICRAGETCLNGVCSCGEGDRCIARKACIAGACVDRCEPNNGADLCIADCGTKFASCFGGPESAFCEAGGAAVTSTVCNRDIDCAGYDDVGKGFSGRCVARLYASSIVDLAGPDAGVCVQVQTTICPSGGG